MLTNCKAPGYVKKAVEDLRRQMDQETPNWTEHEFFCRWCRAYHVIIRGEHQVRMTAGDIPGELHAGTPRRRRHLPAIPRGASESYCIWHETSSPELHAPCAYCGTDMHAHQDALGKVKSGRAGLGYLIEKCPAGHHENAVMPVFGKKTIRTAKLEGGAPVLQMSLLK